MAVSFLSRLEILRETAPCLGTRRSAAPMKPRVFIMSYPGAGQAGMLDDLNSEKAYRSCSTVCAVWLIAKGFNSNPPR